MTDPVCFFCRSHLHAASYEELLMRGSVGGPLVDPDGRERGEIVIDADKQVETVYVP